MYRTNQFIDYFMSFHGKGGLYPIKGITPKKIKDAVCELSLSASYSHKFSGGDTFDREVVRDFILMEIGIKQRMKDRSNKLKETKK